MASVRDGSNIIAAMINAGVLKPKSVEDTITEINLLRNKFMEWHTEGISSEDYQKQGSKPQSHTRDGGATENQRKATWAIIHGSGGRKDLETELSCEIDDLSFEEASQFIDKYGRKKK